MPTLSLWGFTEGMRQIDSRGRVVCLEVGNTFARDQRLLLLEMYSTSQVCVCVL